MTNSENITDGMITIASQELNILIDKMRLEFDTLIALYRLDKVAIRLLKKIQKAWDEYVEQELKLVEYEWMDESICQLQMNARKQELVIVRTLELQRCIEKKRNKDESV